MSGEAKYAGRLHVEGIPEDEPVFLFRAQDKLSTEALARYREACISAGLEDMARSVDAQINRFVDWQVVNGSKLPD